MNSVKASLLFLAFSTVSANAQSALDTASFNQTECFGRWEQKLASSTDPIELVAEAVFNACMSEVKAFEQAAKSEMTSLSWSDVIATRASAKKAIMRRLVVWRVAVKSQIAKTEETKAEEPKTREGKVARCDANDAQWREWAAERGHARFDMIQEHENDMVACRAAAAKLPTAYDYHAANP